VTLLKYLSGSYPGSRVTRLFQPSLEIAFEENSLVRHFRFFVEYVADLTTRTQDKSFSLYKELLIQYVIYKNMTNTKLNFESLPGFSPLPSQSQTDKAEIVAPTIWRLVTKQTWLCTAGGGADFLL